jgi:hypothetical protein
MILNNYTIGDDKANDFLLDSSQMRIEGISSERKRLRGCCHMCQSITQEAKNVQVMCSICQQIVCKRHRRWACGRCCEDQDYQDNENDDEFI